MSNKILDLTDYNSINEKLPFFILLTLISKVILRIIQCFFIHYANNNLKIIRILGAESLFYTKNSHGFFFSSDQNYLIDKIKKVTLNRSKLIEYLNWDYTSNDKTFFNEIYKLEPHHYLNYTNNTLRSKKYSLSNDLFNDYKNKDNRKDFKFFLFNAVANLANKGKNLGLMLSGGLDIFIAIALKSNFNQ